MPALFSKPIDEIASGDIEELIREHYPETELVEFKEALPSKKGQDGWYNGSDTVSDYARNQLLAEIVAFANAHGGHLIIGIAESDDHPRRASRITPIPRCADFVAKFKLQIRDCIDPTIPLVGVNGVALGPDGEGVVVIRVPQSRMSPHRLMSNKECYIRHSDRCETMTMREIQDLTIQRMRGVAGLDEILTERGNRFRQWIATSPTLNCVTTGCRISLVPTTELYVPALYRNSAFLPPLNRFHIQLENGGTIDALVPNPAVDERPILRGTRRSDNATDPSVVQEVHCSGLIELIYRESRKEPGFYASWILGVFCNGLLMAEAFRRAAGAPEVEYAFELEIAATSATVPILEYARHGINRLLGTSPKSPCLFPRMSLGDFVGERNRLIEIVMTDVLNSCGVPFSEKVKSVSCSS